MTLTPTTPHAGLLKSLGISVIGTKTKNPGTKTPSDFNSSHFILDWVNPGTKTPCDFNSSHFILDWVNPGTKTPSDFNSSHFILDWVNPGTKTPSDFNSSHFILDWVNPGTKTPNDFNSSHFNPSQPRNDRSVRITVRRVEWLALQTRNGLGHCSCQVTRDFTTKTFGRKTK